MSAIKKTGKALIVEHSSEYERLYRHCIRLSYETVIYNPAKSFLKTLEDMDPDVVIVDIDYENPNGIELIKTIRSYDTMSNVFTGIVLVSKTHDHPMMEVAAKAGADCFCIKDHAKNLLLPLLHNANRLRVMTDTLKAFSERLLANNAELEMLSVTDELTGLFNMRYVKNKLQEEFERAKRDGSSLAVLMIDIDHFKEVNDNADHLLGSYVIGEVGREIYRVTRRIDTAGRYGGDEFVVLLPSTQKDGAYAVAERLHERIKRRVYSNGYDATKITISQGISVFDGKTSKMIKPESLMREADKALYQAKDNGRNSIVVYSKAAIRRRKKKVVKKVS